MRLHGHEDDVHSEELEVHWKDVCVVEQFHTCARHTHSFVVTVEADCR